MFKHSTTVSLSSEFSFDSEIFYFNSVRIKIDSDAYCYGLTIKQADIKGSRIQITVNHGF
mgnify:CR=1 FL=1